MHVALNAHLLSGEASYRSAGIHGYIYNLLAHLPADHRYTVMVGEGQPAEHPTTTVHRTALPTANPLTRIFWEQAIAPVALRRLQPDLHHGMAFATPLLWGGRSVVTIHDLGFIRYPQRLTAARRLYLRTFTRLTAQRADRIIAVSESGRSEIHHLLGVPLARIDAIPHGVDAMFHPIDPATVEAFRREKGLPERFILHVGTIEPRKNLDTLLHAFATIPQRSDVALVLVGGRGWQTEPIFALIDTLDVTVIMPGYVPNEDLPLWYNAAELFAFPSVYEGFGMPVLEAMACGTPVAAANTTSLPEVVGPEGVLISPTDTSAWAAAIADLLDNPAARDRLADYGIRRASQFTWGRAARLTVQTYEKVIT